MNRSSTPLRRILPIAVLVAALLVPVAGASASPDSSGSSPVPQRGFDVEVTYKKRILTFTGDAGNNYVTPECFKGTVHALMADLGMPCKRVKEIRFIGKGGEDTFEGDPLLPKDFTSLTAIKLDGGPGPDTLYGWAKQDIIKGGAGADSLFPSRGKNLIDGGTGDDEVSLSGKNPKAASPTLITTVGSKTTVTKVERADVAGSEGNDVIDLRQWKGSTKIDGYDGNDTIYGSPQVDHVRPAGGKDTVILGKGNDVLYQGPGNDTISGGPGQDILETVVGGTAQTATLLNTSASNTSLPGVSTITSVERFRVYGNTGTGIIVNAAGTSKPVYILGSAGPDTLIGGSNGDTIYGYLGDDILSGGGGNDFLDGQLGASDSADGGDGFDTCMAESTSNCEA